MRNLISINHSLGADKSWGRAPEAASNVPNSHQKRREKAKMRGILSVNTTVPQLVHAPSQLCGHIITPC